MSLLHATWLFPPQGSGGRLLLWADTWRVASPVAPGTEVSDHPLALSQDDLAAWLDDHDLWSEALRPADATLTLPSRRQAARGRKRGEGDWSGLPLQAGEPIPKEPLWWPWRVEGWALEPGAAAEWLSGLPLAEGRPDLADELRWWTHLQRWALSLIARGRWLPLVEEGRARWQPLINREADRRRLEEMAARLPQAACCAMADGAVACRRPGSGRLRVASLLEALLDGQMRAGHSPDPAGLDPLLAAWDKALAKGDGRLKLEAEESERLEIATHHWREAVTGRVAPARACLELFTPPEGEELWELRFSLQAEADPSLRLPAGSVWARGDNPLQLGEVEVDQPGELLLEGMGRALQVFAPIERGLDASAPETMQLTPAEAFVLVRTAAAQLRDVGVGVLLPASLSGGLASRLGLAITAELPSRSRGFSLGESLEWSWELMIGGVTLSLRDLERLQAKRSP
ncbi:MAG: SNF2 helicase-associated domain-containing protein, partial [Synechococcaceae cyanobacterium]|nr:SNF2 helicase-associated domain-containing protein [Synechococcaceae cyanobacterium]